MITRKKTRKNCNLPVTIGFIHGTIQNISESGFMAVMRGYIKSGMTHFITIQFPNNLVTYKGRINRFEPMQENLRPTGFIFEDLREDSFEKKKLLEFIGTNNGEKTA